uniref:Transmembrane protein n=1 Tax=Zea mays TaxID=4577 RepID=A0A804M528_MAIZE
MGFVLVVSLPFIFLSILLGFGCYFLGKHRGREEMQTGVGAQIYSTPLPPPSVVGASSPPPQPFHSKKEVF